MSRARVPRRVKWAQQQRRSPTRLRHWRLVRRYYVRLSSAVKHAEAQAFLPAELRLLYRLEGHTPVHEPETLVWATWMEHPSTDALRQVALDRVGSCQVSTVFLGVNYEWDADTPPILFETMVFDLGTPPGPHDHFSARYSSWGEAVRGHAELVALLQAGG